jgi:hypothetical protein
MPCANPATSSGRRQTQALSHGAVPCLHLTIGVLSANVRGLLNPASGHRRARRRRIGCFTESKTE